MKKYKKLSIVVPVFNEEMFIKRTLSGICRADTLGLKREIVVVNDGSTDKTLEELKKLPLRQGYAGQAKIKIISYKKNRGKGAAITAALKKVSGDIVVIQDADLEYDPKEYRNLLAPILEGSADVVYGSRFMGNQAHRVLFFWHMMGNKMLTLLSNMFTNLNLTDMETGYKMFNRKVARRLRLQEKRFGFEPEFTAKVAKMGCRVYEIGIGYRGRSYDEGKKIGWKDGLYALWCILHHNFFPKVS